MPEQSLYTEEVKALFHSFPKPFPELSVAVVDYGPYLTLRIARSHFESFGREKKASIMHWISEVMAELTKVTTIYLEVV